MNIFTDHVVFHGYLKLDAAMSNGKENSAVFIVQQMANRLNDHCDQRL
jgi:hypothetical protein